jgi:hypothetical protein
MEVIELIRSGLEQCKGGIDRTLNSLSADEINWHPKPDANSIALVLFHLARLEDSMISTLSDKPSLWDNDKWYVKLQKDQNDHGAHYTADQVAKFTVSNVQDLVAYYDKARTRTLNFLKNVSANRLDDKVNMPVPPPPSKDAPPRPARPEPTVGRVLYMILSESVSHGGEISYIRGLKRGMDK